jgi:hypothetical protein
LGNNQNPYEISNGKHVMVLYGKDEDRTKAAVHWINQALEEEQLVFTHPYMLLTS